MQFKSLPFECKVDMDARTFSGYASVFGNVDHGNDRVMKGAFKKTIRERFKGMKPSMVKVLWQHYQPLGLPTELYEDERGLGFTANVSKTPLGDEALTLMEDGVVSSMSFGYDVIKWDAEEVDGIDIRNLKELKLWEISPVTFGMNEETAIIAVSKMLEGAPIDSEAKSLLMLAARMGFKTVGEDDGNEINTGDLIAGFDERMKSLLADVEKFRALVESGQPGKPTVSKSNEPLMVSANMLAPLQNLFRITRT